MILLVLCLVHDHLFCYDIHTKHEYNYKNEHIITSITTFELYFY